MIFRAAALAAAARTLRVIIVALVRVQTIHIAHIRRRQLFVVRAIGLRAAHDPRVFVLHRHGNRFVTEKELILARNRLERLLDSGTTSNTYILSQTARTLVSYRGH